jgi:hypothetical protein
VDGYSPRMLPPVRRPGQRAVLWHGPYYVHEAGTPAAPRRERQRWLRLPGERQAAVW